MREGGLWELGNNHRYILTVIPELNVSRRIMGMTGLREEDVVPAHASPGTCAGKDSMLHRVTQGCLRMHSVQGIFYCNA